MYLYQVEQSMKHTKLAGITFFIGLFAIQSSLIAETFRARIVKAEGYVHVVDSAGKKRLPEKNNLVSESETVITSKVSKAILQFEDGAMSVMDEKSSLVVEQ